MIYIYILLSSLLTPFAYMFLIIRRIKGKEEAGRVLERIGAPSTLRPDGKLVWIHCASVGESISMLKVAKELVAEFKDIHVLFTSGTVTSASILKDKLPERTIHQYVPIDTYFVVRRFIEHWRPDLLLLTESEIWPNLLHRTIKNSCPIILVNARVSDKSFRSWNRLKNTSLNFFIKFKSCIPQSDIDKEHLRGLGVAENQIPFMGNIKYDNEPLHCDKDKLSELKKAIGKRKVWLASSTHSGEEEICVETHQKLKESYDDLLTIIVPRHPNRSDEIIEMMDKKGVEYATRSQNEEIAKTTDVYLADTMGELGLFYTLADIVLVGGSMVYPKGIGGHNPIEPAQLNCAVITGSNIANFIEMYRDLDNAQGCIKVKDSNELEKTIDSLLSDKEEVKRLSDNAHKFVKEQSGLIARIIEEVKNALEK